MISRGLEAELETGIYLARAKVCLTLVVALLQKETRMLLPNIQREKEKERPEMEKEQRVKREETRVEKEVVKEESLQPAKREEEGRSECHLFQLINKFSSNLYQFYINL